MINNNITSLIEKLQEETINKKYKPGYKSSKI